MMDMEQAILMIASELQIPQVVLKQINEVATEGEEPDYGMWLEALLCVHDGVTPREVFELYHADKTNMNRLYDLRIERIRQGNMPHEIVDEKILEPEKVQEPIKPVDAVINGMQVHITPVMQEKNRDSLISRCRRYFKATRAPESAEERFKKYADLVDEEHMTKEQQLQVVAAINANLPYSVVKVLANSKYDPEIMEYLAATYLHMTRGENVNIKKEEQGNE